MERITVLYVANMVSVENLETLPPDSLSWVEFSTTSSGGRGWQVHSRLRVGDCALWRYSLRTLWLKSSRRSWSLASNQHLVSVKEVLQFCVAVLFVIAIELQEPAPVKNGSWCGSARLGRRVRSNGERLLGEGVRWRKNRASALLA